MSSNPILTLRAASLTHIGKRRARNEDCIAVGERIRSEPMSAPWLTAHPLEQSCALLVADGMGGHPAGDVASRIAIEYLSAELRRVGTDNERVSAAIRGANRALFDAMNRTPAVTGMGTTIAGVIAGSDAITILNVGDSRVYRMQRGALTQLSHDDTEPMVGAYTSLDLLARALTQCLGGYPDFEDIVPHVVREAPESGVTYLICSDGLHDMLSDAEIAACIGANIEQAVHTLFECAMDAGGIDNISIILAHLEAA